MSTYSAAVIISVYLVWRPQGSTWITFNAIMEVTNYSPCNFVVQCTNKQHNPPFITWSCTFKTGLVEGGFSKAKPYVDWRVSIPAKPKGMLASERIGDLFVLGFTFFVVVFFKSVWQEGVKGLRSSLLWWVHMKGSRSWKVTTASREKLLLPKGGAERCMVCVSVCTC